MSVPGPERVLMPFIIFKWCYRTREVPENWSPLMFFLRLISRESSRRSWTSTKFAGHRVLACSSPTANPETRCTGSTLIWVFPTLERNMNRHEQTRSGGEGRSLLIKQIWHRAAVLMYWTHWLTVYRMFSLPQMCLQYSTNSRMLSIVSHFLKMSTINNPYKRLVSLFLAE